MLFYLVACLRTEAEPPIALVTNSADNVERRTTVSAIPDWYPFLENSENLHRLEERFPTPSGYQRISVEEDSFGAWLRNMPVQNRVDVRAYDGRKIRAPAAAIVPIDVGGSDVQQCADSVLRLYSEYRWYRQTQNDWAIYFTSGDRSSWKDWSAGNRFQIQGSKVKQVNSAIPDSSYEQYRKWLHHTFMYAGTKSLHKDARPVRVQEQIIPGDFFVTAGSPGHAILVLDVAQNSKGDSIGLLGQGFMPAQEFHIIRNPEKDNRDWFILPKENEMLYNPSWVPIPRSGVYRFP